MWRKPLLTGILLSLFFIYYSCDSKDQLTDSIINSNQDTMTIVIHQTCNNTKYNIQFRFDSLLNDSRCPPEALCFWAGNVQVKFELTTGNKAHYFLLLNSTLLPKDSTIAGINYKIIDLTPLSIMEGKYDYKSTKVTVVATSR